MTPTEIGVHTLNEGADNYLSRLGTRKGWVTSLSADVVTAAVRAGHTGWQRTWHPDADLPPKAIIDGMQAVPDDVKAQEVLIINNEGDMGFGRRPGEPVLDWMMRAAKKYRDCAAYAYTLGYRKFTFGGFPMGTFDVTSRDTCLAVGQAYRGMYNNQTLEGTPNGTPVQWWWDAHCYVRTAADLYVGGQIPQALAAEMEPAFDGRPAVSGGVPLRLVSQPYTLPNGHVVQQTWCEPMPAHIDGNILAQAGIVLPGSRTIFPWQWFFTRSDFLFFEEYGIGFNPAIRMVRSSEGLFDSPGTGGAKALGYTPLQVQKLILRMLDILSTPIIVNGVSYAQPNRGFTSFSSAKNDLRWAGYSLDYVLTSPDANPKVWVRP